MLVLEGPGTCPWEGTCVAPGRVGTCRDVRRCSRLNCRSISAEEGESDSRGLRAGLQHGKQGVGRGPGLGRHRP